MKKYIKASRGNACIGIWWYTDEGDIWGVMKPTDEGVLDGVFLQYSDTENHSSLWSSVVKDNVSDSSAQAEIISKGYKSLHRGRVIYNTATMCYQVTCGSELVDDVEFRKKIVEYYQLSGNQVEFLAIPTHYHKVDISNPALYKWEYWGEDG